MTAPYEIYSRLLFKAGLGYPLWNPTLPDYCPKEYKLAGMQVGDVGYLTPDGDFFFLFNISLSKDHPINKWRGVPDDFIPVDLGPSEVYHQSFPNFYPPSLFCYTEKGAKTIEGDITASIPGPGHAPVTVQARGGHHSSHSEAAALVLLKGASKNDNFNHRTLFGWAAQYAGRLYRYANIELGLDVQNGAMYLITGVTNTDSWYISSFSEESGGDYGSFEVGVKRFLSGKLSVSTESSVTGSCAHRYSPPHHKGQNQSVFIRGLKMMLKSDFFRRLTPDVTKIQTATFSVLSKVGPPPYSSGNIHETPMSNPNISSSTTRREESHGGETREGIIANYNIPSSITMRREPLVGETREETASNRNISSSTTRREPHGGDTREASTADKGKKAARNRRNPSPRPSGPAGRKKDGPGGGAGGAGQSGGQGSGGNARGGGRQADRDGRNDNENSGGGKESGSGRQHGVWADKEIFLDDSELDDSADPILYPYHPSDIINKYLLQMCPKSEVALTHDDIWSSIFQESDPVLDDEDLLERINASYTIHELENKACIFVSRDGREAHPQSLMVEGVDSMVGRTSEDRFYPEVATQTLYAQETGDGVALHTDVGAQGHVRLDVADSHKLQLQSSPKLRNTRKKISCMNCRIRKLKCRPPESADGDPCERCVKEGVPCQYRPVDTSPVSNNRTTQPPFQATPFYQTQQYHPSPYPAQYSYTPTSGYPASQSAIGYQQFGGHQPGNPYGSSYAPTPGQYDQRLYPFNGFGNQMNHGSNSESARQ